MKLSTTIGLLSSVAILASMVAIGVKSASANSNVPTHSVPVQTLTAPVVNSVRVNYNVQLPILTNPEIEKVEYIKTGKEINCLAENIYFEARGESQLGQMAVAWVTLNRVKNPSFPDTICEVVWQQGQFSWTNDGKTDHPENGADWADAQELAWQVYHAYGEQFDPTDGAIMFHATHVKPQWQDSFQKTSRIDGHIFYKVHG